MSDSYDVIVAGAGAVGLMLSTELALASLSVLILEKQPPSGSSWKSGALGFRGLHVPSTEALYRRGLLSDVYGGSGTPTYFQKTTEFQPAGHFAGVNLDGNKVDFSHYKYDLPGPIRPHPTNLGKLETVLRKRAESLGVNIIEDAGVSSFTDDGDEVTVEAGGRSFKSRYLVGCDGGQSFVRKSAGFDFAGTEPEFTGYVANAQLSPPLGYKFQYTGNGMTIAGPTGNSYAIEYDTTFDRKQPVTKEHFQGVLRRVTGTNINVTTLDEASSFSDSARQVTEYRKGRVFLAGDSAHIHSPLGGQGLNLGIGDAVNLGWKIAATVKGYANPLLLDTYHRERHAAGENVLDWTRAQTALMRPDIHSKALHRVIRESFDKEGGPDRFVDHFFGLCQRHDLGDDNPLVGRSAPDFSFEDGQRLGTLMRPGGFLVVDFEKNQRVADFVESLDLPVRYVGLAADETLGFTGLLVRPDGLVAWATGEEVKADAVKIALSKWLASPELDA